MFLLEFRLKKTSLTVFPMTDQWDWSIYLRTFKLIFMVNCHTRMLWATGISEDLFHHIWHVKTTPSVFNIALEKWWLED